MFVVETIARIRRAHFVQGKSIKAICRELRVSRKTVRKVIRSEATEFQYEREQQPMPRLGAWREQLDALLTSNEAKPSRERLTLPAAITVPQDALAPRGGQAGLWVAEGGTRAQWRPVQLGAAADGRIEVREGLQAGDVVLRRGRRLYPFMAVTPVLS